jgi:putative ABC transport system ATP-binding protein
LAKADIGINKIITVNINIRIMKTQVNQNSNDIIITEGLGKSVVTSEGILHILASIDLIIKSGESIAIIGESGSGKSTLISLLAGLDTPSYGSITLNGKSLTNMTEDGRATVRNALIGFVFQSFQLMPGLTALENVMLPLELSGDKNARIAATALLHRVGLSHRLSHTPKQLSGGEQQRVALARAFVTKPAILFADEPTGNLDSKTGKTIIDLLFELNLENKTTLILVTHDHNLASLCDRTIQLNAGLIV